MTLLDLIRQPHAFYERLRALPARPARYLWLVLLSGLVGGLGTALLSRSLLSAQLLATETQLSGLTGGRPLEVPPALLTVMGTLSSIILSALTWLVLWGMGQLGAGKEGRAAEVYGSTFLAPLVWGAVMLALALISPPDIAVSVPNLSGLSGEALTTAANAYVREVQAAYTDNSLVRFSTTINYAVYIVQFALAYIGFRAMTAQGSAAQGGSRAVRGVGYPLLLLALLSFMAVLLAAGAGGMGL